MFPDKVRDVIDSAIVGNPKRARIDMSPKFFQLYDWQLPRVAFCSNTLQTFTLARFLGPALWPEGAIVAPPISDGLVSLLLGSLASISSIALHLSGTQPRRCRSEEDHDPSAGSSSASESHGLRQTTAC
jgi:hypothetical protein